MIAAVACIAAASAGDVYGPYPSNYKEQTRTYLKRGMIDPDSMKVEFIGGIGGVPDKDPSVGQWVFAVLVNGKNRLGGFTGKHIFYIFMANEKVTNAIDVTAQQNR